MSVSKVDTEGDWTFGQNQGNYISKSAQIAQNVVTGLRSFKNDWLLDTDHGIDWFSILGNRNNEKTIRREIERMVLETPGVKSIEKLDIMTSSDREATIYLSYTDIYNESFSEQIGLPTT